jgi:hypothetical protein
MVEKATPESAASLASCRETIITQTIMELEIA